MCTTESTVIKIILRALTGMLSNSHRALQRTPTPQMEMGTGSAGGNRRWWRMKEAFSGQRDRGYSCHTHSHTHTHAKTDTHLRRTLIQMQKKIIPNTVCDNERCTAAFSLQGLGWGVFTVSRSPWGIISTTHTSHISICHRITAARHFEFIYLCCRHLHTKF